MSSVIMDNPQNIESEISKPRFIKKFIGVVRKLITANGNNAIDWESQKELLRLHMPNINDHYIGINDSVNRYIQNTPHNGVIMIKNPSPIFGKISHIAEIINNKTQQTMFGVALFGALGFSKSKEIAKEFNEWKNKIDLENISKNVGLISNSVIGSFKSIRDNVVGELEVTKRAFADMRDFYVDGKTMFNNGMVYADDVKTNVIGSWLMIGKSFKIKRLKKKFASEFDLLGINVDGVMSNYESLCSPKPKDGREEKVDSIGESFEKSTKYLEKEFGVVFNKVEGGNDRITLSIFGGAVFDGPLVGLSYDQKVEVVNKIILPKLQKQLINSQEVVNGLYDSFIGHPHIKMLDAFAKRNDMSLGTVVQLLTAEPDMLSGLKGSDRILRDKDHINESLEIEMVSVIKASDLFNKKLQLIEAFVGFMPDAQRLRAMSSFGKVFEREIEKNVIDVGVQIASAKSIAGGFLKKIENIRKSGELNEEQKVKAPRP